jgi:hypothetical protein
MSSEKILSADSYNVSARKETTLFSGLYLRNRSTLDIGVLGYIGILYPKEHPPKVCHIAPETSCICVCVCIRVYIYNVMEIQHFKVSKMWQYNQSTEFEHNATTCLNKQKYGSRIITYEVKKVQPISCNKICT